MISEDGDSARLIQQTCASDNGSPSGQIHETAGNQRHVTTGGGDYAERDIDKRQGIFYDIHYHSSNLRPYSVDVDALTTAQTLLAALPLDNIPDPTPLPPGSRMPFSRNSLLNDLGILLEKIGEYTAARASYERALTIFENTVGIENSNTSRILVNLGGLLEKQKEYEAARIYYERALIIREKYLPPEHHEMTRVLRFLSALLVKMEKYVEAQTYLMRVLEACEASRGFDHPTTQHIQAELVALRDIRLHTSL